MYFLLLITELVRRKERQRMRQYVGLQAQSNQSLVGESRNTIYGLTIEEIHLTASQSRFTAIFTFVHIAPPPLHFPCPEGLIEERSRNKREIKSFSMNTVHPFI